MSILFRMDYEKATVVAVECANPSYPHSDADGKVIFTNTHFDREETAWRKLLDESEASLETAARRIREAETKLHDAKNMACNEMLTRERIMQNLRRSKMDVSVIVSSKR